MNADVEYYYCGTYYYLVYLPCLRIMFCSRDKAKVEIEYRKIEREYEEDYQIMTDEQFLERNKDVIVKCSFGSNPAG